MPRHAPPRRARVVEPRELLAYVSSETSSTSTPRSRQSSPLDRARRPAAPPTSGRRAGRPPRRAGGRRAGSSRRRRSRGTGGGCAAAAPRADGHGRPQSPADEVVDVVVLADGEALPARASRRGRRGRGSSAARCARPAPARVGVRLVDDAARAVGRDVEELAAVAAGRDVRRRRRAPRRPSSNARSTRGRSRVVTISCCGTPSRAQQRRQRGEPGVQRRRLDVAVEQRVQLVVSGPMPFRRRDALRDVGEAAAARGVSSKRSASRFARARAPATLAAAAPARAPARAGRPTSARSTSS